MDVTNKADVDAVIDEVVNKYGVIDILIYTAGIAINEKALDFREENIHKVIDVNLKGTIFLNQSVGKVMAKQGKGKIVNIGYIGGYMCHMREPMPYESSKAGVHQLTRTFAADLAPYGINVNSIAPTWVNTKMCAGKPDAYYENVNKATPPGRFVEPEELVGAAIFLSTDASNFVTGHVLFVDGGWSISKAVVY